MNPGQPQMYGAPPGHGMHRGMPPQGMPPPGFPPQPGMPPTVYGMPPQGGPPILGVQAGPPHGMPPQGMPLQGMPPHGMPLQGMPPHGMPLQGMPPQGMPLQGMPPHGMPLQGMPPQGMVPQGMPPQGMVPQGMPPQGMPSGQQVQRFQPGGGGEVDLDGVSDDSDDEDKRNNVGEDAYIQFQGYEQVGGYHAARNVGPPPPAMIPLPPQGEPPHMQFKNTADISEQQARGALLAWVEKECCYGKDCVNDMKITSIKPSLALHYNLETYLESRLTSRSHEPFRGQLVDGPERGHPPLPWHIPCRPDDMFKDHQKEVEVPHTAYTRDCHRCHVRGFLRCHPCHGSGRRFCDYCDGRGFLMITDVFSGEENKEECPTCHGTRRRVCGNCGGDGRVVCPLCDGYRKLKHFIKLTVTFEVHSDDHIIEETDMPDELVRDVKGVVIFQQTLPMVWPIISYPVQEINQHSIALVQEHRDGFPDDRILQQRQTLKAVPVTEVAYTWKNTKTRFWVFGQERKVHAPDYPQTCCCVIV